MERKITLIYGPMFAGKTEELIRRIKRANNPLIVKPKIDSRDKGFVRAHSGGEVPCKVIDKPKDIEDLIEGREYSDIFIDEIQFLDLQNGIGRLKRIALNTRIIAAGLRYNYLGKEFKTTASILEIADDKIELFATCFKCKKKANHTAKISGQRSRIVECGSSQYAPVCESCIKIDFIKIHNMKEELWKRKRYLEITKKSGVKKGMNTISKLEESIKRLE